jgi:hypothetical protein
VKLTAHLQQMLRSKIRRSVHPRPHTPSWSSAWLVQHRDNFTLTLSLFIPFRLFLLSLFPPFAYIFFVHLVYNDRRTEMNYFRPPAML